MQLNQLSGFLKKKELPSCFGEDCLTDNSCCKDKDEPVKTYYENKIIESIGSKKIIWNEMGLHGALHALGFKFSIRLGIIKLLKDNISNFIKLE